jgi:cell division protease FtsH
MVTKYGMSDEVGPVRLQVKAGEGFLGDDSSLVDLSPETQRDVEDAVRGMITAAQREATTILQAHRRELDTLAARLDAEETLEDDVLQEALAPLLSAIESKSSSTPRTPATRRPKAKATAAASVNGRPRSRAAAKS